MSKEIQLTKGCTTIVDDDVYEWASKFKWYSHRGYAYRGQWVPGENRTLQIALHREIMIPEEGEYVDHINGNPLDNRRENLRIVSHQRNMFNMGCHRDSTSRFKGVYRDKRRNLWAAQIAMNGKKKALGRFNTELEAAEAYNKEAILLFGTHARLNSL